MEKRWAVAEKKSEDLLTQLLLNRGLNSASEQQEFLDPPPPSVLISQYPNILETSPGTVSQIVDVIRSAINEERPIVIHGDYDVDGLCSTAILWETLYFGLGYKNVYPYIPDRFAEGYGLSVKSLERINQQYSNAAMKPLLIAVDCGITAEKEVIYAQKLGMTVVVVDHHSRPAVSPPAQIILWSDLTCAAGLVWLLSGQLLPEVNEAQLDLVALATLADLQPLLGLNRSLVKNGLTVLNRSSRLGLRVLLETAGLLGKEVGTYEVGWIIGPRLNAAGRLESALDSLRLLCTRDRLQAQELVGKLNRLNVERQRLTAAAVSHATVSYQTVQQSGETGGNFILVQHESYHEGVIGLVAGRLAQTFNRPALVLNKGESYSKGSARSVPGLDITVTLRKLAHLFEDLGGHPMAAGFVIKNDNLRQLEKELEEMETELVSRTNPVLEVDARISLAKVDLDFLGVLKQLAPYGIGNPEPTFLSEGLTVGGAQTVGATGQHLKFWLQEANKGLSAIWFSQGGLFSAFPPGSLVDVVYTLEEDRWDGEARLLLKVKDMRALERIAS